MEKKPPTDGTPQSPGLRVIASNGVLREVPPKPEVQEAGSEARKQAILATVWVTAVAASVAVGYFAAQAVEGQYQEDQKAHIKKAEEASRVAELQEEIEAMRHRHFQERLRDALAANQAKQAAKISEKKGYTQGVSDLYDCMRGKERKDAVTNISDALRQCLLDLLFQKMEKEKRGEE